MGRLRTLGAEAWRRARRVATAGRLTDTYYYLLEHPQRRHLDLCRQEVAHETPTFSQRVYENSRGKRFLTRAQAYRDWLDLGRRQGLAFNEGMNTCLKVVLKIKDDAYLLPKWMDYYARLVGWHNIIVMDCGSTDEAYLALLASYADRVLIFSYPHYYDNLHDVGFNRDFYRFVARNCKYLCVVDADEFVFGHRDGSIGRDNVLTILSEGDAPVYPGTWYANVTIPVERDGAWQGPLAFAIGPDAIASGTFNGKAIVRSDLCLAVEHVGHNLHVGAVAARIRPSACGRIGVLHVSNLGRRHARARILRHLKAKGLVPANEPDEAVERFLAEATAAGRFADGELHYVRAYQRAGDGVAEAGPTFETNLITGPGTEPNPNFAQAIAAFDFGAMLPS